MSSSDRNKYIRLPSLLSSPADITRAIQELSTYNILWLDTEIADWNSKNPRLSLIQILANLNDKTGNSTFILDLLKCPNLVDEFIQKIIRNPRIEKVFHNANFDLQYLGGKDKALNITCTYRMAQKLTKERLRVPDLKLKTLAVVLCNFPQDEIENEQTSDWRKRPLSSAQLKYAMMDPVYLACVHQHLLTLIKPPIWKNFNILIEFFQEEKWSFSQVPKKPVLLVAYAGENGKWTCSAEVEEEQEYFIFYSRYLHTVPPNKLEPVAEFLMRINEIISLVNFEMNLEGGEVRCKTSIDFRGACLTKPLIKSIVYRNTLAMDFFLPSIEAVSQSLSPTEAIRQLQR